MSARFRRVRPLGDSASPGLRPVGTEVERGDGDVAYFSFQDSPPSVKRMPDRKVSGRLG